MKQTLFVNSDLIDTAPKEMIERDGRVLGQVWYSPQPTGRNEWKYAPATCMSPLLGTRDSRIAAIQALERLEG